LVIAAGVSLRDWGETPAAAFVLKRLRAEGVTMPAKRINAFKLVRDSLLSDVPASEKVGVSVRRSAAHFTMSLPDSNESVSYLRVVGTSNGRAKLQDHCAHVSSEASDRVVLLASFRSGRANLDSS
jgi:hypothetical protein